MVKNNATYDVFIAYDHRDAADAQAVADVLHSHGLNVFFDAQQLVAGTNLEDATWEAMAESHALVVVLPKQINSSWLAFELGAAKAWNKPIYAVSAYSSHQNLPATLRKVQILPTSRTDEIARRIATTTDPLTDDDIKHLRDAYIAIGLSVDQLLLQPKQLAKLVKHFNKTSGRHMAGEQVMWHMLRLRKQGHLPVLKKRTIARE